MGSDRAERHVVVPVEPTEEMLRAGQVAVDEPAAPLVGLRRLGNAYRAMLAAAPAAPPVQMEAVAPTCEVDWRASYIRARDALYQFQYPPDPKMLREIADEIDCGSDCEHGHTEWDTNAHVCSRSESKDGCASEKAWHLRQFADAIEARAEIVDPLAPASPVPSSERDGPSDPLGRPTYDDLIAALAQCREAIPDDPDDDVERTSAIAYPLFVPDLVKKFVARSEAERDEQPKPSVFIPSNEILVSRDDIIEMCAKVADNYARDGRLYKELACETADELAARIRALKGGA